MSSPARGCLRGLIPNVPSRREQLLITSFGNRKSARESGRCPTSRYKGRDDTMARTLRASNHPVSFCTGYMPPPPVGEQDAYRAATRWASQQRVEFQLPAFHPQFGCEGFRNAFGATSNEALNAELRPLDRSGLRLMLCTLQLAKLLSHNNALAHAREAAASRGTGEVSRRHADVNTADAEGRSCR